MSYEFPDTYIMITKDKMFCVCSKKKRDIIEQANSYSGSAKTVDIVGFTISNKDKELVEKSFGEFLAEVKNYAKVGLISKDNYSGDLYENTWKPKFEALGLEQVDVTAGISHLLAVKDPEEMKLMKTAANASSAIMSKYVINEIARIIDDEERIKHEDLSTKIEKVLENQKILGKCGLLNSGIELGLLDWCYTPVFQSGSDYDLKPSAMSNEKKLVAGVVLASVGLRYSSYCSNVGRTILIDPSTNQQNYYKKLLALQEYLVSTVIKDGVSMKAVYEAAQAWLGENEPNLVQHLPKTLGFGTGIEYRDSLLVISAKNETVIKKDMTINLILGFQNLNENGKEYALLLADTLVVGDSSSSLISNASKDLSTNSYFFKASEDAEASPAGKSKKPVDPTAGLKKSKILNTRLRGESKTEEENGEQKRREHQRDLLETLIKEGTQRFSNKEDADANKEAEAKKIFRKYESYRGVAQYPSGISKNHIYVDRRQETIFLPLFGMSVPFHFNTLKNFSKSEEGEYTYLRFNFNTPGQTGTKKDEVLPYDDPNANFVRSFTFRSTDRLRYNDIYKQITDLKRDLQKKEQERRQKADLVEQDRLVEARRNLGVLSDVGIRPHLEGKRLPGDLHIHENGLRFVPVRGDQRLDILFGNIKHLIFQPCDHELYVILHCHLKNPIMVGKKKTKDVQFFKDASDMNYDETNNARRKRRTYGDEDELQAEQEERKRRSRLNKEFKAFAEKISEVSDIITDMPSRDLGKIFTSVGFNPF
jgi:nucleosome binding factor SPN SPT16 subunit